MNKANKLIVFITVLSLLAVKFPVAYASEEVNNDYSYMTRLLAALEIIDIKEDGQPSDGALNENITRGEFTKLLCYTNGLKKVADMSSPEQIFTDVGIDSEYARVIYTAYHVGLVTGYANGTFSPQSEITITEAATMSLCMMGYKQRAETQGGYLAVASNLGLLKHITVTNGGRLTRLDAYKMFYHALHTNVMTRSSYPAGAEDNYEIQEGSNLLWSAFKVTHIKGTLDGNDLTRLRGGNDIMPYHVTIDGKELYKGNTDAEKLLGYYVEAYYRHEDFLNKETLIYIRKLGNTENVVNIADLISIADGNILYYDKEGRERQYTYDPMAAVIYNGVSTKYPINDSLIPDTVSGTIRLISKSGGSANVLIIEAYTDFVVKGFNTENATLYDLYNANKRICLDKTEKDPFVELFDENGEETGEQSIIDFAAVTVFESKDDATQRYIRAYINRTPVRGIIEEVRTENGRIYVKVDEQEYSSTRQFTMQNSLKLTPGTSVEFAVNCYREIVGARTYSLETENEKWGYLINADIVGGLQSSAILKILTSDGRSVIYRIANRMSVDGVLYNKNYENVLSHLNLSSIKINGGGGSDCYAQALKFTTNHDNKIIKIDTVINGAGEVTTRQTVSEENMVYFKTIDSQYYYSAPGLFGGLCMVDKETKVFYYPNVADMNLNYKDESNYTATSMSVFQNAYLYTVKAYYVGDTKAAADVLAVDNGFMDIVRLLPSTTSYSMVSNLSAAIDDKGEACVKIDMYTNGVVNSVLADPGVTYINTSGERVPVSNLELGDCILYAKDIRTGKLKDIELGYSAAEDKFGTQNIAFTSEKRLIGGYVYKFYSDGLLFSITNNPALTENADMEYMSKLNCPVIVYDSRTDNEAKIYAGGTDEIDSYNIAGAECSRVIINSRSGMPRTIFVVK